MPSRAHSSGAFSALQLRQRLDFTDAQLLAECEVHTYRASGPGGQKRNKTSSAVRLHHHPTGLITIGTESRSQHENKARALRRLREAIAVTVRIPPPDAPRWPDTVQISGGILHVSSSNPAIYHVIGLVLDALAAHGGILAESAAFLKVTASSLTRFLAQHPRAWAEANRIRAAANLPSLK
jgi:hypothetical protein